MARPKTNVEVIGESLESPLKAKWLQLNAPIDKIGPRTTISTDKNRNALSMELLQHGVLVQGKESNTKLLIPYSNIRCIEIV